MVLPPTFVSYDDGDELQTFLPMPEILFEPVLLLLPTRINQKRKQMHTYSFFKIKR